MQIDVRDILAESVGYERAYKVSGERPAFQEVRLTDTIEGEITIARLETGLLVRGRLATATEHECDRCLRTFSRPLTVRFQQQYALKPGDDELPIDDQKTIDLAPLIEQEIILNTPIKLLHDPNCRGIENAHEQYTKEDSAPRLKDQARITKGTKRGRTQET